MTRQAPLDDLMNVEIEIERTKQFMEIARQISDCMQRLPLTTAQNNELIGLIVRQVCQAERDAFSQGVMFVINAIQ